MRRIVADEWMTLDGVVQATYSSIDEGVPCLI
jgi:hypothetical protein